MGCDKWSRDTSRNRFKPQATSFKLQASSFKLQATSFKQQAATFRALPGLSCHGILSSNKSNGALASVPMRDLLIPLVDRPSHKSDSVRPARGSFPFPKIKASSRKLQAPSCSRCKRQASSVKQQASSFKPQAASSRTLCPSYSLTSLSFSQLEARCFTRINVFLGCLTWKAI